MDFNTSLKFELVIPDVIWAQLFSHLFPGDGDEHGAVVLAGVSRGNGRTRLLARDLFLARDGVDYVEGQRGYRMLTPHFITDKALIARDAGLAYLAIHNHGGTDRVRFSEDDMRSHERGYPALRDITRGQIIGGLVFAVNAVAGDLWLEEGRATLTSATILGSTFQSIFPEMPDRPPSGGQAYDRQIRLFGDRGQAILRTQRVGVIGLGGVGSIVCELLARLGIGSLVLIDPDRIELSNVPRTLGSNYGDALRFLTSDRLPRWIRSFAQHRGRRKVKIAARSARRASPGIEVLSLATSVVDPAAAYELTKCDYLFLAADSMQARLVFNAITQQFFIPGVELGTKIPVDNVSGVVGDVFTVVRPVLPRKGCLWCNGLISAAGLQNEAISEEERKRQRYIDDPDVHAPSVISLNAIAAAHGVNEYLFRVTGLRTETARNDNLYFQARTGEVRFDLPRNDPGCLECGVSSNSRYGRGNAVSLPVREPRQ